MTASMEERFQTLSEIVKAARQNLAPGPWDYLIGGAETETTLKRNRHALDAIAFRPRVLRDVSKIDCTASLFDRRVRIPVMLAPVGSIESFDPGGGASAALAAAEFGVPHMLSSVCNPGLEATAAAAPDNFRIFQLYVRGDDAWVDDHVKRAKDHGYTAFCLTVDTASYSRRERDLLKRFVKPWRVRASGFDYQAGLNWDHVKRFKDIHDIPLILKGIATAEDATLACEHGVDVVYVSNHGGRQLDQGRGTMEVLPEVVAAVARPRHDHDRRQLPAGHRRRQGHCDGRPLRRGRTPRMPGPGGRQDLRGWCERSRSWKTRSASAWVSWAPAATLCSIAPVSTRRRPSSPHTRPARSPCSRRVTETGR